jgi:hypothetical protein
MKPLRFIHIAKTGGQSISAVAKEYGKLNWGMNDEGYGKGVMCHNLLSCVNTEELNNDEAKNKYDWFMVVRNPYHRILSKYNMLEERKEDCNTYIKRILDSIPSFDDFVPYFVESNTTAVQELHHWPHIMPQSKYLEPQYNIIVLHYENLNTEFKQLMKQYGYNFTIDIKYNTSYKLASLSDLSLDTIEYINRYYEKDFITFGYEMKHELFPSEIPGVPTKKYLRFIHNARAAGVSIAYSAKAQQNLEWGILDKNYGCLQRAHCRLSEITSKYLANDSMKNQYDWFVVVRNPYDRILSAYNSNEKTDKDINTYIQSLLQEIELNGNDMCLIDIMYKWPEMLLQCDYLEKQYNINVLRYENLESDFNALMKKYEYDIKLMFHARKTIKKAVLSDLTLETIEYINRFYSDDFKMLGYEMRHEVFPVESSN